MRIYKCLNRVYISTASRARSDLPSHKPTPEEERDTLIANRISDLNESIWKGIPLVSEKGSNNYIVTIIRYYIINIIILSLRSEH